MSNSKGAALTVSILCRRYRHRCLRTVNCRNVHGPSVSTVQGISPTVRVRRRTCGGGPHSAIKAIASVCASLQVLCRGLDAESYPTYKGRFDSTSYHRRARGATSSFGIFRCYPRYTRQVRGLAHARFSCGAQRKTYTAYRNLKRMVAITRKGILRRRLSLRRNTIVF